jgi:hypothetical protein
VRPADISERMGVDAGHAITSLRLALTAAQLGFSASVLTAVPRGYNAAHAHLDFYARLGDVRGEAEVCSCPCVCVCVCACADMRVGWWVRVWVWLVWLGVCGGWCNCGVCVCV